MVTLTKIYTRGGDKGKTSLGDGSRIAKHDIRVDAYGSVDETNATIGLVRLHVDGDLNAMLERIQNDLFDLGADLCTPETGRKSEGALRIVQEQIDRLETEIDTLNAKLDPLTSFVLPGGTPAASYLHLVRTVCRRAERLCTQLAQENDINPLCIQYLNRLSDHAFVMARFTNDLGKSDVLWKPGAHR
jgi:cob(I)alamin adenosyltransferase